eukprot:CAMPEP_0170412982 /NCGR_PEP_ID=MMETSP0117_2-20130122/31273_1 /TAXON_ID=400756 /ORGANISM="Durinskia baltica, Strain CSIRO CS-38" /LENGTH=48 /DNA_ID= /DNA_START= /DNA_END= /DNA_ORIENTATION=
MRKRARALNRHAWRARALNRHARTPCGVLAPEQDAHDGLDAGHAVKKK